MKALEQSQLLIDYSDAQGQLTLKSAKESGQNSNSSKLLWLFLLPARMEKIHPKMKVLALSVTTFLPLQVYWDFSRRLRAANS